MDTENRNWFARLHHLHYVYIIIILVLAIIAYLAYCHCSGNEQDKQLLTFLGFAATISSIILSVLAIIITVLSSSSTDRLRDTVMTMSSLPKDVESKFNESSAVLKETTASMAVISEENAKKSEQIISSVERSIQTLSGEIEKYYIGHNKKLEEMSKLLIEDIKRQAGGGLADTGEKGIILPDDLIRHFLSRTSKSTLSLIVLISRFIDNHVTKPISLSGFSKSIGFPYGYQNAYFYGSIVQMSSLSLIEYLVDDDNIDQFRFIGINSRLKELIEDYSVGNDFDRIKLMIDEYLEKLKDTNKEEGKEK